MKTKDLPPLARKLCDHFEAWIIGGAANPSAQKPRDIDISVPHFLWVKAAVLIPKTARPNTFGGWKVPGKTPIDIWPDDLARVVTYSGCLWAWQPRLGIRIAISR